MPDRPYISFQEVKEKVPIPDVLDILGVSQQFTRKGDRLSGICPLPQHDHGPRPNPSQFKIDRKNGTWLYKCFGDCSGKPGGAGDVVEFVKAMTGLSDAHVRFWFAEHFGDRLSLGKQKQAADESGKPEAREDRRADTPQAPNLTNSKVSDSPAPLKPLRFRLNLDADVPYLRERGLSEETIRRFSLGLCSRGVLKGYVAIPIRNWPCPDGQLPVAYLGRWPGDDFEEAKGRPRYKWPEGFPKSQVVFGLHEALAETSDSTPLIIVEGPFATFHLVESGFPAVASVLGSSMSDEQAGILARTGRAIVLMFDGDEAGRQGMRQAAAKLIKQRFVRVAWLPDGAQPDDLGPEELQRILS